MGKHASAAQVADVAGILARHARGHDIAQAVIERQERVLVPTVTLSGVIPPLGGRIHVLWVPVDESRSWSEAVKAVGPNTSSIADIHRVGTLYPPKAGSKAQERVVILVNFGTNTMGADNIAWGKSKKLRPSSPRAIFAVAEHNPNLDEVLGMKGCMAVVSLKECSFRGVRRAPDAWWRGAGRGAGLDSFDGVWDDDGWFAFSRESLELGD